ncbi:EF-hand calcium-binding domain-containing protein 11-like isoform X40 [Balaenoptera acutorostrata]|uniref:EF-hand calcium-binding domain-containing protein 11-like isoform X28 n=1 Tax=Balaenoptera acutorostrata TaxID=9767 RepID=A0ABM3SZS5_BALAC|nr:EF-hand calcium-binding domain-containing protein 11-like isoform X28 [Balaenoptera acutorostrata]XP_057398756.1 EF-hand calcium-binding domain-containing protein 11-like isoform X40 [Balaenoptera acutorostrata]
MFFSQAGARPRMWEASPSEYKKWVEVFKACDEENKGCLSRENFKVAVVMLFGYKPSKIEADAVMSSVDPNTSDRGYLTLEDFKKAFKQVAPKLSERIILEVFRGHRFEPWSRKIPHAAEQLSPCATTTEPVL